MEGARENKKSASPAKLGSRTEREHASCPGAYLAIQEADILLQRLLAIPGLRIESKPTIGWSEIAQGYELRNFILAVEENSTA